ncbi:MAG TPA: 2Fe-2S iron-sulfur cluster binding domain-containing protein [Thermoplasmata archaeon]|nr:2Fe-2S iron-sulfur cluster binding domain-containing protein [Thermoplasmata archaeon]
MITIDGKKVEFVKGETILQAAQRAGIYIPTLCTEEQLGGFGACRMCLVEVDGVGNLLPACTTPVEQGMVIRTRTEEIQKFRRGIIELLLSEHPSACIFCKDKEECQETRGFVKSGRVTGCRFCPENQNCELVKITEYVGLECLSFPLEYREFEMRREDPFIFRDPNLCILCGKCVRVCAEIRGREAISFIKRGHRTEIGTSFGKPLIEVGCMFCGACVDVCPTGSLSPRSTRWHGKPEKVVNSLCLLCGASCEFEFVINWGKVVDSRPLLEGWNKGQGCLRGRFCLAPLFNSHHRLKYPLLRKRGKLVPVSWEEAIDLICEKLKYYKSEEIGFLASPYLTNEAFHLLQKISLQLVKTENLEIKDDQFGRRMVAELLKNGLKISSFEDLENSDLIIVFDSDLYLRQPVLTVNIQRAKKKGGKLVVFDLTNKNLFSEKADLLIKPEKGEELFEVFAKVLKSILRDEEEGIATLKEVCKNHHHLLQYLNKIEEWGGKTNFRIGKSEIEKLARFLRTSKRVTIILANDSREFLGREKLVLSWLMLLLLFKKEESFFLPVLSSGNSAGISLLSEKVVKISEGVKFLYLTDSLPEERLKGVEFLVVQAPYPFLENRADVVLPSTVFAEDQGSVVSSDLNIRRLKRATEPQALAKTDFEIFKSIAEHLAPERFGKIDIENISKEVEEIIFEKKRNEEKEWRVTFQMPELEKKRAQKSPFPKFRYRGAKLEEKVEDFRIVVEYLKRRMKNE